MRRGWFLLLALSVGLNAGLLYALLFGAAAPGGRAPEPPPFIEHAEPLPRPPEHQVPPARETVRRRLDEMTRRLRLDARQRERMNAVIEETLPGILDARDRVQQARREVRDAYRSLTPDPVRVHESVRAMNRAQALLDSLVAETMLQESGLLDGEQMRRYFDWLHWGRPEPPPRPRP